MRCLAIIAVICALTSVGQSQGTLNFITGLPGDGPFLVTDCNDIENTKLTSEWSLTVLAGPQGGPLAQVSGVRAFGVNHGTGHVDSDFNGVIHTSEIITVGTVPGGSVGSFQLAVFQTSFGTYANALANNAVHLSWVENATFGGGDPSVAPPDNIFIPICVPEPTMISMIGLGGLLLYGFRRRP